MNSVTKKDKVKSSQKKFEMICRSNPKEIGKIEKFIRQISKRLRLDDGTMYRLLVSCTEAVNNAIIHGNKSNLEKKVIVRCVVGNKNITMSVIDEGKGFDSEYLPDPRDEINLLKENGRGVFLMRSMMDNVIFKQLKIGYAVEMKMKLHWHT